MRERGSVALAYRISAALFFFFNPCLFTVLHVGTMIFGGGHACMQIGKLQYC